MQTVFPRWIISFTAIVLLVAACGTAPSGSSETTTTQPATTTTPQSTTTTTVAPTTTVETTTTTAPLVFENGVGKVVHIVYLEMNGHEYRADVYVPEGEGPWPVVVALHGATVFKGDETNTAVARAAAEAGMVVFAPNWVRSGPSAMGAEFVRSEEPVLPCALAFAQQEAAVYGGDPNRTVVYGLSGGATAGAHWVLGPTRDLTSGCLAQTPPMAPVGVVLGDASYFRHGTVWDGAFDEDIEEMQIITAETVDPVFWNTDLPERILVWVAADGSFPRSFDDPWDDDGWFAQRDPDGTIREDLDELGELDDGVITYVDEGLLLAHRLQQAGIDATFEILPGGHTSLDKVPEIVAYLLDVAEVP